MMAKWVEAYAQWPATNQMTFSLAVLMVIAGLLAGGGWLSIRLLGMHHQRPIRPTNIINNKEIRNLLVQVLQKDPSLSTPALTQLGHDWEAEQRRIAEDSEFQTDLQRRTQEELAASGVGEPAPRPPRPRPSVPHA